ncbi:hypothetical protein AAC387_Pa01g0084 [Persea americana]
MVFDTVTEEVWISGGDFCKGGSIETQFLEEEELGFEGIFNLHSEESGLLGNEISDVGVVETALFQEIENRVGFFRGFYVGEGFGGTVCLFS